ncbi:MAG: P-loop NTPase [Acidobacteriota bacterium]|nr:P-loop NTPase [Acidobacteriota bacterium]
MKSYFDIAGDGGSDVAGQVAEQRSKIARNLSEVRHLVAVGSGKGGVGKSTLTMQIAQVLACGERRVAILDADLNGPSQARLAGLAEVPPVPGEHGLVMPRGRAGVGVVSMGAVVPETRAVDFDTVAEGESHTWRATREFAALSDLLATVEWGTLDVLFVDLPPGAERVVQYADFLGPDAAFILVTLPSDLARGVVSRSVDALRKTSSKVLGYVENMSGYYCAGCGELKPLFPGANDVDFTLPLLGTIPFDPDLAARCDRGEALPEDSSSPTARAIRDIAARVAERLESAS